MDFELSDDLKAARDLARDFAAKEIAPTAAQDDKEHKFRKDLVRKMGELGFFGCVVPEEYGGTDTGFVSMVVITEEIARIHRLASIVADARVERLRRRDFVRLATLGLDPTGRPQASYARTGRPLAELLMKRM